MAIFLRPRRVKKLKAGNYVVQLGMHELPVPAKARTEDGKDVQVHLTVPEDKDQKPATVAKAAQEQKQEKPVPKAKQDQDKATDKSVKK